MDAGAVVAHRFEVGRRIARGGMAIVYQATDRASGARVALKVADGGDAVRAARLLREAEILGRFEEPGIVRYVAHGTDGARSYLALEWIEGTSLHARLAAGPLGVRASAQVCGSVASALAVAHGRGIVHRDVTPANVLLPTAAADRRTALIDFGLALDLSASASASDGESPGVAGTPGFVAPEQVRAAGVVDGQADVFALGCVLFRCLTAKSPLSSGDPRAAMIRTVLEDAPRLWSIDESIPAELDALVARMLARAPADRPDAASVAIELAELEVVAGGDAPSRPVLSPEERAPVSIVLSRAPRGRSSGDLRSALARVGPLSDVRVEILGDGTLVLVVADRGAATERVARAARCALALGRVLPAAPISLSSVTAAISADAPLGDVVERGTRALEETTAGTIRIDDATAGLLDDAFEVRADPTGPVLLRERPSGRGVRTLLGRSTPFVGRKSELAALEDVFERARGDGRAALAVVEGGPGMGKSRLRHEWLQRLASLDRPPRVWIGRTDPHAVGAPFALLGAALRDAAGLDAEIEPSARRQKLRGFVGARMPEGEADTASAFLAEALGMPGGDEARVELRAAREDRALMGHRIRRAWQDLLAAEARDEGLVLVLEDVHWGDRPSLEIVDAALGELSSRPFAVLALMRPEARARFPDLWATRSPVELPLGSLDVTSCAELARDIVGAEVDEARAAELARRSAGNPFHLEEIARAIAQGRGDALPETVLAVAHDRLARLDPAARRVLRATSILGGTFSPEDVGAVLGAESPEDVAPTLERLVEEDLVVLDCDAAVSSVRFALRHEIVRDAAYATLTPADRTLGHRMAAELLERKDHGDALTVAEHFASGDRTAKAARWYVRAAAQALRANDYASAIACAERAVSCGATGTLLGDARFVEAEAAWYVQDWPRALRASLEAKQLLPAGGSSWHACLGLVGLASGYFQDVDRVVQATRELLAADVAEDAWPTRFLAGCRIGGQVWHVGNYELGGAVFHGLERNAGRVAHDPVGRAALHRARALWGLYSGDAGRYLEGMLARSRALEDLGDERALVHALTQLGNAYTIVGTYELAVEAQRESLRRAERVRSPEGVAEAKQGLCWALAHVGALGEAIRVAQAAIEAFGTTRTGLIITVTLAIMLTMNGQADAAEPEAKRAVAGLQGSPMLRAIAGAALAEARLALEDAPGALEAALAAKASLDQLGSMPQEELRVRLVHARALRALGDVDASRTAIREARDVLLAKAQKIADPKWRASFLENVPTHATTLQLAREWLDEPA